MNILKGCFESENKLLCLPKMENNNFKNNCVWLFHYVNWKPELDNQIYMNYNSNN